MNGRQRRAIAGGLLLLSAVLWAQTSEITAVREVLQRLDWVVYDLRLRATLAPPPPDERLLIVDIDEKSLRREGHWPWPRDRLATLVERLFEGGAAVVVFDVVFAEAERNPLEAVLQRAGSDAVPEWLRRQHAQFDNDRIFADALGGGDVVLGYMFHPGEAVSAGQLPVPPSIVPEDAADHVLLRQMTHYTANLPLLQEATPFAGFFTTVPDADGLIRRVPLLIRHDGALYPSLALEAVRAFLLLETITLDTAPIRNREVIQAIRVGAQHVPTDGIGQALVPFRGGKGSFTYVSAAAVLAGEVDPHLLEDRIVLIGTTAGGLFDLRATPVQADYPGVEVHANVIAGILDNAFPLQPAWALGANFTQTLFIGLLLALLLPWLTSLPLVLVALLTLLLAVAVNVWLWSAHGLVLSLAPQLLVITLLATFNAVYGFMSESRHRHELKTMFGQYVPPELVEKMNRDPGRYDGQGEDRELTILFADIRSFTTISEALSASRLKEMLNRFFTPITAIIFEQHGTIDKYVGDMVMAFWGAPVEDPQHAEHAISAALAMLQEVERLKPEFQAAGFPEINIGIGLNTGVVSVGDMGSRYRRAYTVLGDAVNLASRLEGTSKYYGVGLVVGENTRNKVGDAFVFRELDRVRVKGKAQAITVYEPLGRPEAVTAHQRQLLEHYHQALAHYRSQQWDDAERLFRELQPAEPGRRIHTLYLERIAALREAAPGADWDGVYDRQEK